MGRLIEKEASGIWQVKGIQWEKLKTGETITKEISQLLYGCLCKLKDYEDSGMNPDQVGHLQYEIENMAEQFCDKLCRYRQEVIGQEELDAVCKNCPVSACVGIFLLRS